MDTGMRTGKNEGRSVRLLETCLYFLIFLAPAAFGSVHPWATMSTSAFLFFLLFLYPESISAVAGLPHLPRLGFVLVFFYFLFQCLVNPLNPGAVRYEFLKWVSLAAGFLLIQQLPRHAIYRLAFAFLIAGLLESLYGLYQQGSHQEYVLWQTKEFHRGFVTGTYLNRNHFAGLLEMCLGIHLGILFWVYREKNYALFFLLGALLVVSLAALLKSGSRAGILSFCMSLLVSSCLIPRRLRAGSRGFFSLVMLSAGAALVLGSGIFGVRFFDMSENLKTFGERAAVWKDALRILRAHPWAGSGLGSFEWIFPVFQSERLSWGWSHAHNDYLELAIGLGIPAFLMLGFSFMGLLWQPLRQMDLLEPRSFAVIWGCLISILSLLLHSAVDFNLAIPANAMIFIFLFAMMTKLTPSPELKGERL